MAWCGIQGVMPLPAEPATVAGFLAAAANAGSKPATLTRRMAAIRYAHRLAGHPTPTDAEPVRAVMRGIRRQKGSPPDQKAAATADRLRDMLATIPDTLAGKRDRALLALGIGRRLPAFRAGGARGARPGADARGPAGDDPAEQD